MQKPILVTGAPRSGTTWVGRMISQSAAVTYIHEPFNANLDRFSRRPESHSLNLDCMYFYISKENEYSFHQPVQRLLNDPTNNRVLIKDPIGIFSAEWLASRFDMDVIVMIRHPAAFVGSLKLQNWKHKFTHFLRQPLLIDAHFKPFLPEIERAVGWNADIIERACLLWKLIYHVIGKYCVNKPHWHFIRHEDLSMAPVRGFKAIFAALGLEYPADIQKAIADHSAPLNAGKTPLTPLHRNSRELIHSWKKRLTAVEIQRVRQRLESVSRRFYGAAEWESISACPITFSQPDG